jgi:hypothetical protein
MDQRSSNRKRTILDGRIIFNNRGSVISCAVRDLSDTGARIAFGHTIPIPSEFEIEIPKKGIAVLARVMWSNGNEHGIMFTNGLQDAGDDPRASEEETRPQTSSVPVPSAEEAEILQKILDEAQHRIARAMGAPADAIRLKLEIDPVRADLKGR